MGLDKLDHRREVDQRAREAAASVVDPELPMITIADLGVLRDVTVAEDGAVTVTITPTYSGCPAMATIRDDLVRRLHREGFDRVEVDVVLHPPWSTDRITPEGRAALADAGISPPGPARGSTSGTAVPLTLAPARRAVRCPQCDSTDVEVISEFGSTACKAIYRCRSCRDPFDHVKEI